jgi:hypothetical protein
MASSTSWWAGKARQFGRHVVARVTPVERAALADWLTPAQLALFDGMPVADRRHGLDVVAALREAGVADLDVALAGLFHDAGKGRSIRLWHRVAWSLGELSGPWVHHLAARAPGGAEAMARLRDHDARSAELAAAVGCPARTVALIKGSVDPADPAAQAALAALRAADEAG